MARKQPSGVTLPPQEDCEPLEPSDFLEWEGKECVLGPDGKVSYRETDAADGLRSVARYIDRLYENQPAVTGRKGGSTERHQRTVIEGWMKPLIEQGLSSGAIVKHVRRLLETSNDLRLRELGEDSLKRYYLRPLRKKLKAREAPGPG